MSDLSSLIKDQTHNPGTERWSLTCWVAREVPSRVFPEKPFLVDHCHGCPSAFLLLQMLFDFFFGNSYLCPCGLGGDNHTPSPVGWIWPIRVTVTSSEMPPHKGSRAKPGDFSGAFRKKNPLSDRVAKPVSQFRVYMWRTHVRMVPRWKKAEIRGRRGGEEGRGEEVWVLL